MGKNRLLDTCYKALGLALLTVVLSSCTIPRIIVLKDPLTPEEHINLGLSYESQGEYDAALEQYNEASKELPAAYLYKGNLFFLKGEYEKAEAAYEKAINTSGDPRAYNNLAWLYFTLNKEMEKAEGLAEKAVCLSPESEEFRNTLYEIRNRKTQSKPD